MAVPEQTPYIEYTANGVAASFAVTFQCLSKDTLIVTINGVEQLPALWSLTGSNVVFISAPVNNSIIGIKRSTTLKRDVSYQTYDNSLRPAAIDADIDRLWHALQEQNFKVGQYDYDYNYVLKQVRPISTGGTGANNPEDARTNLSTYSKEEVNALVATGGAGNVVGINGGGTGGTTAQEARSNLNAPSITEMETAIEESLTLVATETVAGKAKIATSAITKAGTNDTDFVTPKKLKENTIAYGVDWRNVSTSRVVNTTYRNDLPRPIIVRICFFVSAQSTFTSLQVGGVPRDQVGSSTWASNSFTALSAEVPSGAEYKFDVPTGSVSQIVWGEL